MTNIIEARELVYSYPNGTSALNNLSLAIKKGQRIALLGANGAGKSTLLLHLNGILRPKKGTISFQGQAVDYRHRSLLALRKNVGIVFQEPDNQLFTANVLHDVSFGPLNLGLTREMALAKSRKAMRETETVSLENKPTHFLSFGQKKRVAIAGVLAMEPQVIIFDEPTAGLDPKMALKIMDLLHQLSEQGKTLIISTHDVDLAYSWADYVYFIKEGKIAGEGMPQDLFLRSDLLTACDLCCPWIIEIYQAMMDNGLVNPNQRVPVDKNELLKLIKQSPVRFNTQKITAIHNCLG